MVYVLFCLCEPLTYANQFSLFLMFLFKNGKRNLDIWFGERNVISASRQQNMCHFKGPQHHQFNHKIPRKVRATEGLLLIAPEIPQNSENKIKSIKKWSFFSPSRRVSRRRPFPARSTLSLKSQPMTTHCRRCCPRDIWHLFMTYAPGRKKNRHCFSSYYRGERKTKPNLFFRWWNFCFSIPRYVNEKQMMPSYPFNKREMPPEMGPSRPRPRWRMSDEMTYDVGVRRILFPCWPFFFHVLALSRLASLLWWEVIRVGFACCQKGRMW